MYLLIKPASGSCNLRCRYCFYADEVSHRHAPAPTRMTDDTFARLTERAAEHLAAKSDRTLSIGFQGGEPTLAGLPFFRRATELVRAHVPPTVRVSFAIQTNGTLIDDDFAAFFAENDFLVGLSMDGTREINDRLRPYADGRGTHGDLTRAIRVLERHACRFNILTVVTEDLARHPLQVYRYYRKAGLSYQQFIPCIPDIDGTAHPYSLTPETYGRFLCTLFDLWFEDLAAGSPVFNREFENYVGILCRQYPEECGMSGRCAVQYVIEANGDVYPCDFYALDEYRLGNVETDSFAEIDEAIKRLGFVERSVPLPDECMHCPYGILCRGGCYRYRDASGKNVFCDAYRTFFAHALPKLNGIAEAIRRQERP